MKLKSIFKSLLLSLANIKKKECNISKLHIEELGDGINRKLVKAFTYKGKFGKIKVPKNFTTDYLSSPRIFWLFAPPATGKYKFASVVHDWLYRTEIYKRSKCDRIFLECMYDTGVDRKKAYIIYLGAVLGGWWTWYIEHDYEFIESYRSLSPKTKFGKNRFKKK